MTDQPATVPNPLLGVPDLPPRRQRDWWRDAVIYQVYVRSFADHDGDGIGDLAGIRSRLPYLADLRVDALWITPFYRSPLNDGGYDVADYRRVDPVFGDVGDVESLVREAHAQGLRVVIDIVPNHTSTSHRWFREALESEPGSRAWQRYHCVPGRGHGGHQPPSDWTSVFGGPAWSEIAGPDGSPSGWWYLHLFDDTQADLNWADEEVRAEFLDILGFWFDRGVDGFRIDVAHGLVKETGYPDIGVADGAPVDVLGTVEESPMWDQPAVHDVFRGWRAVADRYRPPRAFVGEVWVASVDRQAAYIRPDELHTVFNFDHLKAPWWAEGLRDVVDRSLHASSLVGAPTTWVLENHDVWRVVSRYAPPRADGTPDLGVGRLRARAGALVMLALPGSAYLYQGQELGLHEVLDLPPESRQDPIFARTDGLALGRDGCRVPLPWEGDHPSYGFGPPGSSESWLPQPPEWADLSVAAQRGQAGSVFETVRSALDIRRREAALGDGVMRWLDGHGAGQEVLVFERPAVEGARGVLCAVNMGRHDARLPASVGHSGMLLVGSDPRVRVDDSGTLHLPPDAAAWLRAR